MPDKTADIDRYCVKCKRPFSESEKGQATGFCGNCREKEGLVDHHWWSDKAQEGHYGATSVHYHVAPRSKRDQIQAQGLRPMGLGFSNWDESSPEHVHLWDNREAAHDWAEWSNEQGLEDYGKASENDPDWDVWEVNTSGLKLKRDTELSTGHTGAWKHEGPISGDRLKLAGLERQAAKNTCPRCGATTKEPDLCVSCQHQMPLPFEPEPDKHTAIIGIGIPGSGKSTLLKNFARQHGYEYVSSDETRGEVTGDEGDISRDDEVWPIVFKKIHDSLGRADTVIDATNANSEHRRNLLSHVRERATEIHGMYFDTPIEVAKQRNQGRDRIVPDEVLDNMHRSLQLNPPVKEDGFDTITRIGRRFGADGPPPGMNAAEFKAWHENWRQENGMQDRLPTYLRELPFKPPGGCARCRTQGVWHGGSYLAKCPNCKAYWNSTWEEVPSWVKIVGETPEQEQMRHHEGEMGNGTQVEMFKQSSRHVFSVPVEDLDYPDFCLDDYKTEDDHIAAHGHGWGDDDHRKACEDLGQRMKQGYDPGPVVVTENDPSTGKKWLVLNGTHRAYAAELAGIPQIDAVHERDEHDG